LSDKYAVYNVEQVRVGSLGATHFTHGMACAYDEVPCDIENISKDGRMNRNKIFDGDDIFKNTILTGVEYKIMKWVIHAALPQLTNIIMSALNTTTQISEGELIVHENMTGRQIWQANVH
jgi:hypothetical protein